MKEPAGFGRVPRGLFRHPIARKPDDLALVAYLISNANAGSATRRVDLDGHLVPVGRNQFATTYRRLAGLPWYSTSNSATRRQRAKRALRRLEEYNLLRVETVRATSTPENRPHPLTRGHDPTPGAIGILLTLCGAALSGKEPRRTDESATPPPEPRVRPRTSRGDRSRTKGLTPLSPLRDPEELAAEAVELETARGLWASWRDAAGDPRLPSDPSPDNAERLVEAVRRGYTPDELVAAFAAFLRSPLKLKTLEVLVRDPERLSSFVRSGTGSPDPGGDGDAAESDDVLAAWRASADLEPIQAESGPLTRASARPSDHTGPPRISAPSAREPHGTRGGRLAVR